MNNQGVINKLPMLSYSTRNPLRTVRRTSCITEQGRDSDWTRLCFYSTLTQKYYFILNSFTLQSKGKDVRSPFQMKTIRKQCFPATVHSPLTSFPSVTKVKTPGSKEILENLSSLKTQNASNFRTFWKLTWFHRVKLCFTYKIIINNAWNFLQAICIR